MTRINLLLSIIVFSFTANTQIKLKENLNKSPKEETTNTSGPIEILFSSKINKDGSKDGIEFKNEFGVNDKLYFSFYFPKTINKIYQKMQLTTNQF